MIGCEKQYTSSALPIVTRKNPDKLGAAFRLSFKHIYKEMFEKGLCSSRGRHLSIYISKPTKSIVPGFG